MEAKARGKTQAEPVPGWRRWLPLGAAAAALLLLSEALWLWQTWPVRELLQPTAAAPTVPR